MVETRAKLLRWPTSSVRESLLKGSCISTVFRLRYSTGRLIIHSLAPMVRQERCTVTSWEAADRSLDYTVDERGKRRLAPADSTTRAVQICADML